MSPSPRRTPRPPALWRLILMLVVRGADAEFVLGDIEEDYREVRRARGGREAARWYRRQALATAWAWLARRPGGSRKRTLRGGGDGMKGTIRGIRHAVRALRRAPGFTLATVVVLGLGLGGAAAVLALTTSLLSPLPFPDSGSLVSVWQTKNGEERAVAPGNYLDWRRTAHSFDGLAAYDSRSVSITADGTATRTKVVEVSGNFFAVLGVQPELGGGFEPHLDTQYPNRVAVLSHALWEQGFSRDPEVLGRTFQVDDLTYQVVGVMPTGFAFPNEGEQAWVRSPHEAPDIRGFRGDLTQLRDAWYFRVVGRLAPGNALAAAREEMTAISARLEERYPRDNADAGVLIRPLLEETLSGFGATLVVLGAAVLLVLLAAAVNVAHLTLARTATRRRALAVRVALGAGRGAVLRHLLAEAWLLGLMGGMVGVALATVIARWGVVLFGPFLPRAGSVAVSPSTAAAAVFLGLAMETLLALLAYRAVGPVRWQGGTAPLRAQRLGATGRDGLVAAQVAAAIALGVGATLLGRSLLHLADVDLGFDTRDLVTVRVAVPDARLRPYPERLQTLRALAAELSEVAGISTVGLGSNSPLSMGVRAGLFRAGQAHESDPPDVGWQPVDPGYFHALGMRLVRGRDFEASDDTGTDVGILNETAARLRFPGENPLGRQVTIGIDGHDQPITVVGVVADTRTRGPARAPGGVLFRPMAQVTRGFAADAAFLAVRTPRAPATMPATARDALARLAPGLPVYSLSRGEDLAGPYLQNTTGLLTILAVFAGTALLLGAVGVYGVAAYTVRQQRREIGVRVALGAAQIRIMRDVVGGGMRRAGLGVPVGIAGAILLGRGLSTLLFEVRPTDPLTYGVVSAVVLGVTAVALWIPARLAAATDAAEVLREA